MPLPAKVSESTRRLNPHLFGGGQNLAPNPAPQNGANRLRQNRGPKLNKTETEFEGYLRRVVVPTHDVEAHALTFALANGCRYTPDFIASGPDLRAYEVKGKHAWDDAIVKLKVAARRFPYVQFWLAYKQTRTEWNWRIERVHP